MFHRTMVAYNESPEANKALDAGINLAKALQSELSIVTVVEPLPSYFSWAVSSLPATR
jgi:nucleotide-binding universal stress UspA family protein